MSARAVLDTAYTVLAQRADAADEKARMFGNSQDAVARDTLDRSLGLSLDDLDLPEETNVIQLAAFVSRVNATMGS